MKKKCCLVIFALLLLLTALSGCTKKEKSKKEILADIPNNFLSIIWEKTSGQRLTPVDLEIIKRQIDERTDTIYCTVSFTSTDDADGYGDYLQSVTANCLFKYNYYDEGGWILDACSIYEGQYEMVMAHAPENIVTADSDSTFGDNYFRYCDATLCEESEKSDHTMSSYVYDVSRIMKYCTLEGKIRRTFTLETSLETATSTGEMTYGMILASWACETSIFDATYQWNLSGDWRWDRKPSDPYSEMTMQVAQTDESAQIEAVWKGRNIYQKQSDYEESFTLEFPQRYADPGRPYLQFWVEFGRNGQIAIVNVVIYPDHAICNKDQKNLLEKVST